MYKPPHQISWEEPNIVVHGTQDIGMAQMAQQYVHNEQMRGHRLMDGAVDGITYLSFHMNTISSQRRRSSEVQRLPTDVSRVFPDFDPKFESNAAAKQRKFLEEWKIAICESDSPKFASIRQRIEAERELIEHVKNALKLKLGFKLSSPSEELEKEIESSIKQLIGKWKAEDSKEKKTFFLFRKFKARPKRSRGEDVQMLSDHLAQKFGEMFQANAEEKSESLQNAEDEELAALLKKIHVI